MALHGGQGMSGIFREMAGWLLLVAAIALALVFASLMG